MALSINLNSSDLDTIETKVDEEDQVQSNIWIALVIVGILSVSGTIGNALVLYAFSRQKQKLTSTLFILTLAGTDFISSLITMPYTIVMESLKFQVKYDVICKLYHFIVTTTIPFSAFIMVVIAVDRYLGIVHPFKHTLTLKRAKITVVLLAVLAGIFGLLCSLVYGVSSGDIYDHGLTGNITSIISAVNSSAEANVDTRYWNVTLEDLRTVVHIEQQGHCRKDEAIFNRSFFSVYKKLYSALYAICAVIVIVLYGIIYHSLLERRRHVSKQSSEFWTPTVSVAKENGKSEFSIRCKGTHQAVTAATMNGDSSPKYEVLINLPKNMPFKNKTSGLKIAKAEPLLRSGSVSSMTLAKMRIANIKTARMLSIVALTYILAFLPAWLMAHHVVPMNVIVFYLYFTYNVANPIIYAFLNQSFRKNLKYLIKRSVRNR